MTPDRFFDRVHSRYGDPESFLNELSERLEMYGITRSDLARRAGFQTTQVSRWLNRNQVPQMRTLVILDEAIHRLVEEL